MIQRRVFLDTSALFAVLDADDESHEEAARTWNRLLDDWARGRMRLVTHNGIVLESSALVARRLGMRALRDLHDDLLPLADIVWIREPLLERAAAAMFAAGRRGVSLTDWVSFELMRHRRLRFAFTFDTDFEKQGFRRI